MNIKDCFQNLVKAILNSLLNSNSLIGSGLFCGFITASTVGLGNFFVVSSLLKKDIQKRVAIMTGFVMGQFVMFTAIYVGPLHQVLVQPHNLIMVFLISSLVQFFWTNRKTLHNEEFLHPEDVARIKRLRVLHLQLDILVNFFVQLCNPHLEPNSMVVKIVKIFLFHYETENRILFVIYSLIGWFIGHIFFLILFTKFFLFIVEWVHNRFFKEK